MKNNIIYFIQAIIIIGITCTVIICKGELSQIETQRKILSNNQKLREFDPVIYKKLTSDSYEER